MTSPVEDKYAGFYFTRPETQTCEVMKDKVLLRTILRPVPLMWSELDKEPTVYATSDVPRAFLLNKGVIVWKYEDQVIEQHPDGLEYVWWNPDWLFRDICKADVHPHGSFFQKLPSGGFQSRSQGITYTWGTPTERWPENFVKEFPTYQDHHGAWQLFNEDEDDEDRLCTCDPCHYDDHKAGSLRTYLFSEEKRYKDRLARVTEEAIWEREEQEEEDKRREEEDKKREEYYASGWDDDGDDDYLEHMEEEEQLHSKFRRVALEQVCPPTLQDAHRLLNCAMP